MKLPSAVEAHINEYCNIIEKYSSKLAEMYKNCYPSTLSTAIKKQNDGTVFVLTGDIPAMWLRDSTAQVSHYMKLAKDEEINGILKGVIKKQCDYIKKDPYANAFNEEANGHGHIKDIPKPDKWVWERKYEIDSLAYPLRLIYLFYKQTDDKEFIKQVLPDTLKVILNVWKTEQHHGEKSAYRFTRFNCPEQDTLHNNGMGNPVSYTGLTWSGFRPSDDACRYGYLIASNMFAVSELKHCIDILDNFGNEYENLIAECKTLAEEIQNGINKYAVVNNEKYGKIYACEVDGNGNYFCFDDANVPSLLSIPYLEYESADSEIYKNTRKFILSKDNPYYYKGRFAKGVGSPHTPENYVWHIALSMQGLTSTDKTEMLEILSMLENTDADTLHMHEGFNVDNPKDYSREWFTWSDSLFAEFVEKCVDEKII